MEIVDLKRIVEALLIASPEPLTETRFSACLSEEETHAPLQEIIAELQNDYDESGRAFSIKKLPMDFRL